jgi:hypothetical protein
MVPAKKTRKSLAETHPELAKEADGWDPTKFTYGMNIKVAWKCPKNHSFEATINTRAIRGSNCPVCIGKKVLVGFNDLATTHPKLIDEVDGWDPEQYTFGSNKIMSWKCKEGHKWKVLINSRAGLKKSGCPYCSGLKTIIGLNDLNTTNPQLATQADGWDPKEFKSGSNAKKAWKCKEGHKWFAVIQKRAIENQNCPTCSNHTVLKGFNDIKTLNPKLAMEVSGWDPGEFGSGSNKNMPWKCKKGHTWKARIADRNAGNNCPFCTNTRVWPGFNDLKTSNPKIAKEAVGWDPRTVLAGGNVKKLWECKNGHKWTAAVSSRLAGSGCHICTNQSVLQGYNDLKTTHPQLAKQADGWDPTTTFASSRKSLAWKCTYGHKWKAASYSRVSGSGCPICSNKQVLIGFNDLATTHPGLAKEAVDWNPKTVTFGMGGAKRKWKCSKSHIYLATLNGRGLSDESIGGCPFCSGRKVLLGFNDLTTTHPQLAKEAVGWDPKKFSAGSNKNLMWQCSLGHKWKSNVANRANGRGCPSCSITGFSPNLDGYLYFIEHVSWEMLQIGITNFPDNRLNDHKKLGWEVLEVRGPMDGHLTQNWETSILRMLKKKGADLSNAMIAGKFDGYSEAWSKTTFHASSIKDLMKITEEFEESS